MSWSRRHRKKRDAASKHAGRVMIVTTRVEGREAAQMLVRLVRSRSLAACVHLRGPVLSNYNWQGREVSSEEFEVSATTTNEHVALLVMLIEAAHPYELPAVLVTDAVCSPQYHDWVVASCAPVVPR
jgi:periplasmic divalent cation tolerance protein